KLKTVTIGKSVTKIGSKAFYGCSKIKTLTIKSTKLTTKKIGSKAFTKTPKKMTVKVPKSKLKSYKKLLKAKGVNSRAKIKK
ncbi:MAG: leucine-rich repeat domain-containing protein, partial [Eubacterium sp.]|nr:leucine-rich repeat domain-containing protein [Eubacterium sp.]